MVKKTFYRRRRAIRKRKAFKRRNYRISRPLASRPHLFKRMGLRTIVYSNNTSTLSTNNNDTGFTLGSLFNDTVTDTKGVPFVHIFKLSQMPNYSEFTSLFDKYKICKIVYTLMFQQNTAPMNGNSVLPLIHICSDDDDATVPSSLTELQQRANCKRRVLGNTVMIKYTFRPKIAAAIYNTALSTGYAIKSGYINTDYPDVPHYGIKGMINNLWLTTNNNVAFTIEPVYYLALKEVK